MTISKNDSEFQELLGNKKFVAMLSRIEADACKARFFEFVKSFWEVIIPEEPVYNWHIEYLCDELQKLANYIVNRLPKPYDLIINIPPGTSKSTIVTIMFPAWLWTIDPTILDIPAILIVLSLSTARCFQIWRFRDLQTRRNGRFYFQY